ncbi:MAG: PKD domain-containing protein [Gammaproteobacteria bacterium]|nr:MAG: PKD domain-containing protein [Gammaproteobacteria bacterium]
MTLNSSWQNLASVSLNNTLTYQFDNIALSVGSPAQTHLRCDADASGEIDRQDITLITAAIRQPVSGPNDPRDGNADNQISLTDTTFCRARCAFTNCNSRPVANAGLDQMAEPLAMVTLDGAGSRDADGQTLSFQWSFVSKPAGSTATLNSATAIRPQFNADLPGEYIVRLIVSDGTVASQPDTVQVLTSAANIAPVADAGSDQTVTTGGTVTLDGSGSSDANGDSLAFNWVFVSTPAGSAAIFDDPGKFNPAFTADLAGAYVFDLYVSDGQTTSAPDRVVVTAGGNSKPLADAGQDRTVPPAMAVTLDGRQSRDPEGAALRYRWSMLNKPAGSTAALANPATAQPVFTPDIVGQYAVQLIVNDGKLDSEPDAVVITTTPGNSPPRAVADLLIDELDPDCTGNIQPEPGNVAAGEVATVTGCLSSDPDNDELSYQWALTTQPVGSEAGIAPADAERGQITTDRAGQYIAQLSVRDGTETAPPDTVVINAINSRPPVAIAGAVQGPDNQEVLDYETVQLVGDGSYDPDGCPIEYSWRLTSDPVGIQFCASGPGSSGVVAGAYSYCAATLSDYDVANPQIAQFNPSVNPQPGVYEFTLTVEEAADFSTGCGSGGTSSDTTTVTLVRAPRLSVSDVEVTEGDSGTAEITFTISMDGTPTRPVSVAYATNSGSAATPGDFSPASGSFNWAVGDSSSRTVTVQTLGDTDHEPDETFTLALSAPLNVVLEKASGTATILNDDDPEDPSMDILLTPSPLTLKTYSTGTLSVGLASPAPPGGLEVSLISDNAQIADIVGGSTVTIPAGQLSAPVTVDSDAVAGTAHITATATGRNTGGADIVVTKRTASLLLPTSIIGQGRNTQAQLQLAEPAPIGGIVFDLESSNTAIATVPASVSAPVSQSTATFNVHGEMSNGQSTLTAQTPGYEDATAYVTVTDNIISLGDLPVLGPQASASLPVRLAFAAPAGGITLAVESSDEAIATVAPATIFIPGGQILPAANPQVTGVNIGTATITVRDANTASPAVAPDDRQATVALAVTLTPASVSMPALRSRTLLVGLSAPAPAGFAVALSADDAAVATVREEPADATPQLIEFIPGTLSRQVVVTGVTSGATTVRAAADPTAVPNADLVTPASAAVAVTAPSVINVNLLGSQNPGTVRVGENLQILTSVSLQDQPPDGAVPLKAVSDAGAVTITAVQTAEGAASALIDGVNTTQGQSFWVQGRTRGGSANVTFFVDADNDDQPDTYQPRTVAVTVDPSGFVIYGGYGTPPSDGFTTSSLDSNEQLNVRAARLNPGTPPLTVADATGNAVRGGLSVPLTMTNSNANAGVLGSGSLTVGPGENGVTFEFDPNEQLTSSASATLALQTPAGFESAVESSVYHRDLVATVTASNINVNIESQWNPTSSRVGEDLQLTAQVSLANAPIGPTTFEITSSAPNVVVVSNMQTASGEDEAPATESSLSKTTSTSQQPFWLQGLQQGQSAQITFSALTDNPDDPSGPPIRLYNDRTVTVTVDPSGFVIYGYGGQPNDGFTTTSLAANTSLSIYPARLQPGTRAVQRVDTSGGSYMQLRGGMAPVALTMESSVPAVGSVSPVPVSIGPGVGRVQVAFDPQSAGTTTLTLQTPAGFEEPVESSPYSRDLSATVTASNIYVTIEGLSNPTSSRVGEDLQLEARVQLADPPPAGQPVTLSVTSSAPSVVAVSAVKTAAGGVSASIPGVTNQNYYNQPFWLQGLQQGQSAQITFSALTDNPDDPSGPPIRLYNDRTVTVTVDPSGFVIYGYGGQPNDGFTTTSLAANTSLSIYPARLQPGTRAVQRVDTSGGSYMQLRGGMAPVALTMESSVPAVGSVSPVPVSIGPGVGRVQVAFDPQSAGTTTLTLQTPAGFEEPVESSPYSRDLSATVTASNIYVTIEGLSNPTSSRVGEDLQLEARVQLADPPPAGQPVTLSVTSSAPSVVAVSAVKTAAGGVSASIPGVTNQNYYNQPFWLQGLQQGQSAQITFSAPGYNDRTVTVTVDPSGFVIYGYGGQPNDGFTTTSLAANTSLSIYPARLQPGTRAVQRVDTSGGYYMQLRGGMAPVALTMESSVPAVGSVSPVPVSIGPGVGGVQVAFDPQSAGTTTLTLQTPAGFEEPVESSPYSRDLSATVVAPRIYVNGSFTPSTERVGEDLQVHVTAHLENNPTSGSVTVTATSANANAVIVSTNETGIGAGSAQRSFTSSGGQQSYWVQGLQQGQTVNLTFSAPGYTSTVLPVAVDPSGFVSQTNNFTTTRASSNTTINLYAARLNASGSPGTYAETQEIRGGLTASVPVTMTSTPASPVAGAITTTPVVVQAIADGSGTSQAGVTQFDPNNSNNACTVAVPCIATIEIGPAVDFDAPTTGSSYDRFVIGTVNP